MSTLDFAWHVLQASLRCWGVKALTLVRPSSSGGASPAAAAARNRRTCSTAEPWQVSQLMPGSAQTLE